MMPKVFESKLKRGMVYHCKDGYYFKRNAVKNGTMYLKCIVESCPVRGKTQATLESKIIVSRVSIHNHPPNRELLIVNETKDKMLRRCEEEDTPPSVIFNEEISKLDEDIASSFSESEFVKELQKKKTYSYKPIKTLPEFIEALDEEKNQHYTQTIEGLPFFQGTAGGNNMVFISPTTKALLKNNEITFAIDRTFRFMPIYATNLQLISVIALCPKKAIAIAFAIMETGVTEYVDFMRKIQLMEPEWKPQMIVADYEDDLRYAINVVFPDCSIVNSWFHFSQAIRTKIHQLNLLGDILKDEDLHTYTKMLISLPILPADLCLQGFNYVSELIQTTANKPHFRPLLLYVYQHWFKEITPENFSVYCDPRRIDNYYEVFHGHVLKYLGGRTKNGVCPSIWHLVKGLARIEHYYAKVFSSSRLSSETEITELVYTLKDTRIANALEAFQADKTLLYVLLHTVSTTILDISEHDEHYYPSVEIVDLEGEPTNPVMEVEFDSFESHNDGEEEGYEESGEQTVVEESVIFPEVKCEEGNIVNVTDRDRAIVNNVTIVSTDETYWNSGVIEDHRKKKRKLENELQLDNFIIEEEVYYDKEDEIDDIDNVPWNENTNPNIVYQIDLNGYEPGESNEDCDPILEDTSQEEGQYDENITAADADGTEDLRGYCCICTSEKATCVCVPCGHLCLCEQCKETYEHRVCPVCVNEISQVITLVV